MKERKRESEKERESDRERERARVSKSDRQGETERQREKNTWSVAKTIKAILNSTPALPILTGTSESRPMT